MVSTIYSYINKTPLLIIVLLLTACNSSDEKQIKIPFDDRNITIDAHLSETEWHYPSLVENLAAPWNSKGNDETLFKAYLSKKYFNFCFSVKDNTIITFPFTEELTVAKEDRVELFFSSDDTLKNYYCIEIDPIGNILDYSAKMYRIFDRDWDFTSVEVAAKQNTNGYIIEGRISMAELETLGIKSPFNLGIFRADYKSKQPKDVIWYSWVTPNSDTPDFHIPSAFGTCILTKE